MREMPVHTITDAIANLGEINHQCSPTCWRRA
jgi:hypothetical protein